MKFSTILATAAIATASLVHGTHVASHVADRTPTAEEAMQTAQKIELPAGIKLTGTTEPIKMPAAKTPSKEAKDDAASDATATAMVDANQEQFFGGLGGYGGVGGYGGYGGFGGFGGVGGWGGWGGFGPYRFGYSCGGLGGWAYPLGYWNTFGASLWGGGCGLGLAYGGLYYC